METKRECIVRGYIIFCFTVIFPRRSLKRSVLIVRILGSYAQTANYNQIKRPADGSTHSAEVSSSQYMDDIQHG